MIIHSLELNNFRQFTGNQKMNFSTDPSKKATILVAESGFGKTTLLQSFQWAFYGECKYKNVLNTAVKNSMRPNTSEEVCVKVVISHGGREYAITRKQKFWKNQVRVDAEESEIAIDEKQKDGTTTQKKGREAVKLIRSIMHPDLYPYFFLEGEKAESIGEQMSKGKSGSNGEFVRAIKGLLGFSHLYETTKHLKGVIATYQERIKSSTANANLKKNIEEIQYIDERIKGLDEQLENINNNEAHYSKERDILSEKIQKYAGVAEKQRRSKIISHNLETLNNKINQQKAYIFKRFSQQIPYLAMYSLVPDAEEALKNSDAIDKGIPGINVDAVKYMLENHKCICGQELVEGSDHWKALEDWITYLPPNNIGYEIDVFSTIIKTVKTGAVQFSQEYTKARKDLNDLILEQHRLVDELDDLNKEIGSVSEDVYALKEQESSYNVKLTNLAEQRGRNGDQRENYEKRRKELLDQQTWLKKQDDKTSKISDYLQEATLLSETISNYIIKREKEKRIDLERAINDIFKVFYKGAVKFKLDDAYNVSITGFDNETYEDFTSGGQDVAVALAFIGAIVKLKIQASADPDEDEEMSEIYPLIMDAPTSKFGETQVKSFSDIMPTLTDQVIIFVNDVYGPKLLDNMKEFVGEQWTIEHQDEFHDTLRRVE